MKAIMQVIVNAGAMFGLLLSLVALVTGGPVAAALVVGLVSLVVLEAST